MSCLVVRPPSKTDNFCGFLGFAFVMFHLHSTCSFFSTIFPTHRPESLTYFVPPLITELTKQKEGISFYGQTKFLKIFICHYR